MNEAYFAEIEKGAPLHLGGAGQCRTCGEVDREDGADARLVETISPSLRTAQSSVESARQLGPNTGRVFEGPIPRAMGFVLDLKKRRPISSLLWRPRPLMDE